MDNIAYFPPLGRAWNRMKVALFQPFDLHKWFVVGFTAFLANLTNGPGRSNGSNGSHDGSFREFLGFPDMAWDWLINHPGWFMLIAFGVIVLIVIGTVLLWLSSRGKFMFLHNVVHDKAEVANPWREYAKEGNSLFLWRLFFGLFCFVLIISLIVIFFIGASQLYEASYYNQVPVPFIILLGLIFIMMITLVGFISTFLDGFVIPIMYKQRVTATRGWGRFLPLFRDHPFHFILYGLFIFVMIICMVISVIVVGLFTCLIGFIILIIPYISTVATLPIWYLFRSFSIEFLAQFGDEYDVFPPAEAMA